MTAFRLPLLAVLVASSAHGQPHDERGDALRTREEQRQEQSADLDRRLREWTPDRFDGEAVVRAPIDATGKHVRGVWALDRGALESAVLVVRRDRTSDSVFQVTFGAGGCLGSWELARTGRLESGVLVLDAPVQEYGFAVYRKLVPMVVGRYRILVPAPRVHEVARMLEDVTASAELRQRVCFVAFCPADDLPSRMPVLDTGRSATSTTVGVGEWGEWSLR